MIDADAASGSRKPQERKRVLVLCTGNSCRSQMAEGWIRHLLAEAWDVASAGTAPAARVNPHAVKVMAEVGVDISGHVPKQAADMTGERWDLVITVCGGAREICPVFAHPGEQIHIGFVDPADAVGSEDEVLAIYREVRDAIRAQLIPEIARRAHT